ncbi:MAG TPA: hypothetical protein VFC96_04880 [Anaerovoracaceae bacterium]|nr:hypothetical protein [Anaerovoracaceae bacterium]
MFDRLSESIKKTISIADGYKLGRLIFEDEDESWVPYIETGNEIRREYTEVDGYIVEVLNDGEWYTMTDEDYQRVTAEGWPLFGGFDCRFRERE